MLKFGFAIKAFVIGMIIGVTVVLTWKAWHVSAGISLDQLFSGQEKIEDRFYADAAKISGKQALQVAKLQQTEFIERTSSARSFFVDLPDVVVRAKVPVEYGFFVPLTDGWRFRRENGEITVHVPELTNSTPAVDVGRLQFDVLKGSVLRNESAVVESLRQELMGLLTERAILHRALMRDQARESLTGFVTGWLARQTGQTVTDPVRVYFPGEETAPTPK